jgi:hypothetical protein
LTNEGTLLKRSHPCSKSRKREYHYYLSRTPKRDLTDDSNRPSRFGVHRTRKQSKSVHNLASSQQTELQDKDKEHQDKHLVREMKGLSLNIPESKSNLGNPSEPVGIVDESLSPLDNHPLPSPPAFPLEFEKQKDTPDLEFKSPARVMTYSSISEDSAIDDKEAATFSDCSTLSRASTFSYSVPNSSNPQLDKAESLLASSRRGGPLTGSMLRRRSHWWKIKTQLNVLRAFNPSISEENLETDLAIAVEDFASPVPLNVPAMMEEPEYSNNGEEAEAIISEQTPAVKIDTPLEDDMDISPKDSTFIDDLVKDSLVYRRSMTSDTTHLAPPTDELVSGGRSLSINTDRSYSSAASSDLSPSECSLCATKSSEIQLSDGKKGVWSLYLDNILTGVVDQVMDDLFETFMQDNGIRNVPNDPRSRTTSGMNSSGQTQNTTSPSNYQGLSAGPGKRALSPSSGGSPDEEDEDPPNKKRNRGDPQSDAYLPSTFLKRLACPFYRRFPEEYAKYPTCSSSGWETVHRVK